MVKGSTAPQGELESVYAHRGLRLESILHGPFLELRDIFSVQTRMKFPLKAVARQGNTEEGGDIRVVFGSRVATRMWIQLRCSHEDWILTAER